MVKRDTVIRLKRARAVRSAELTVLVSWPSSKQYCADLCKEIAVKAAAMTGDVTAPPAMFT